MKGFRLTTKISLLIGGCAVTALIGGLVLLSRMAAVVVTDEQEFRASLRQTDLARTTQVEFKKQVQEWKDILLRGHDAADFERYHENFLRQESVVHADAKMLAEAVTQPAARTMTEKFLAVHEDLGRRYREALDTFIRSGRVDYRTADSQVRGMDRPPTDLIDHIVQLIADEQSANFAAREAALSKERRITTVTIAAIALALITGSIWLSGRMLAPIRDLTATVTKVSRERNYSLRAKSGGNDEMSRLAEVFNETLTTIEQQDAVVRQAQADLEQQLQELKQSEAKLADSLSILNATLDSTADGLLVVDVNDRVTAVNRKFAEMWRIPAELLAGRDDRKILAFGTAQLKDPAEFLSKVQHLYADREAESFDVLVFADGRIFERYSQPQRIKGITVGRVWSFRDITARKQAEDELERLNKQMLQTARQAGIAEVATGVLHNIGNVLNSVNVASSCVTDSLKRSKSASLSKIVALMREHEADIGHFLTQDPKGKQMLNYLGQLGEHLVGEHTTVRQELAELQKNVEHMKDLVTRQLDLSRTSAASETVKPSDLFDDALKINQSSIARHEIEVVREYGEVPSFATDKNQVLQILVNFVRNAVQANGTSGSGPKRLVVRITPEMGHVRFSAIDNGVGISAENLGRIFAHGFTTKKDGHGFGLHSCMLIARELGGTLAVQSEGLGKGATFTLDLPSRPPEKAT
jgi:PAS domain S-box-containing protein